MILERHRQCWVLRSQRRRLQKWAKARVPDMSSDTPEPPVRIASAIDLTRILRAAGLSKAAARAVVSNGWKGLAALSSPELPQDEITALVDAMEALRAKLEERQSD